MTYKDLDRGQIVDELLLDAGLSDASDVRQALLAMGQLADAAAPAPGAELAAMLAGPHDEVSKRRWRHKHRTAVVSVAVVAAMGLGASGVAAASSGFTRSPSFEGLLGTVAPHRAAAAPALPAPDAPKVSTAPAPSADPAAIPQPSPVQPTPATTIPIPAQQQAPAASQAVPQTPPGTAPAAATAVVPAANPPAPQPAKAVPGAMPAAPTTPAPWLRPGPAGPGALPGNGLSVASEKEALAQLKAAEEKLKQWKKQLKRQDPAQPRP